MHTANFTIPAFTTWNGEFHSTYINDEYKVTSKLNLTLGLRFDYQGPWTERFDRFSTFDPTYSEPSAQADVRAPCCLPGPVQDELEAERSTRSRSMPLVHVSDSPTR